VNQALAKRELGRLSGLLVCNLVALLPLRAHAFWPQVTVRWRVAGPLPRLAIESTPPPDCYLFSALVFIRAWCLGSRRHPARGWGRAHTRQSFCVVWGWAILRDPTRAERTARAMRTVRFPLPTRSHMSRASRPFVCQQMHTEIFTSCSAVHEAVFRALCVRTCQEFARVVRIEVDVLFSVPWLRARYPLPFPPPGPLEGDQDSADRSIVP